MARPVKKSPEQWENEIIGAARELFVSKGYEQTSVSDIMQAAGGAKGMFYRFFTSKEAVMLALGERMFTGNNPFEAVRGRDDLCGLQKIRAMLSINGADTARVEMNMQAADILRDPHILAAAIDSNRRLLTPLWFELLEEARRDGSIKTEYTRELSELLPLVNFWLIPAVCPGTEEELHHRLRFILEVFTKMGLPLADEEESI